MPALPVYGIFAPMIIVRRVLAVILALMFIALYVPLLVLFRVNDTLGNPEFYINQIHRSQLYDYVYSDVLPASLDQLGSNNSGDIGAVDLSRIKPDIVQAASRALPPEWLQSQSDLLISNALPYVLGDTNSFTVTIPLKDRVREAGAALKDVLNSTESFQYLYDQGIRSLSESAPGDIVGSFALGDADIEAGIRHIMPPDWLAGQMEGMIDQIVPYMTRDQDSFTIRIDISGRLDDLQSMAVDILTGPESYDRFVNSMAPMLLDSSGVAGLQLPIGLTLTSDDVLSATRQALPPDWYQSEVSAMVKQVFSYLKGQRADVAVTVSLKDRKADIAATLAQIADEKGEAFYNSLPASTPEQQVQLVLNPPVGRLPDSRPPGISYQQAKSIAGIDMQSQVTSALNSALPDQVVVSDAQVRELFAGQGQEDMLTQARDIVQTGFTFTEADLAELLGANSGAMDDARTRIAAGLVVTEQDLRNAIKGSDDGSGETLRNFDDFRSRMGTARRWKPVAWLVPALLLVGIGFLGGRRWHTRLIWVGAVLLATGVTAYILFGPVFSSAGRPPIDQELGQAVANSQGVAQVATVKAVQIAGDALDAFLNGLKVRALIVVAVSVVLVVVGILMRHENGKRLGV